jgi:hypothetical protein
MDPEPQTETIRLGCTNNLTSDLSLVDWDLTVDPGPIVGGQAFGAVLSGLARFDEPLLDAAQGQVLGGYKKSRVFALQATVHVRSGVAAEAADVVLTQEPIQPTCKYDDQGNMGPDDGPFPTCSDAHDNPDGSNADCTGLGGVPNPENVCGQFVTVPIPTSNECGPGELCESKGKTGPGSQCALNGFCVSGPLEVELQATYEGYLAADSGAVLFGWDDQSTGAVVDQSGANRGSWILPPVVLDEPGPNSLRGTIGGSIEAALDCTMGEGTATVLWPTEDSRLVYFQIATP